jgi:hypothetical protein
MTRRETGQSSDAPHGAWLFRIESTNGLTLRRPPLEYLGINYAAVSKGRQRARACDPSFETHRFAMLLRMRPVLVPQWFDDK